VSDEIQRTAFTANDDDEDETKTSEAKRKEECRKMREQERASTQLNLKVSRQEPKE
jgi:hypothetical protein